MGPQGGGRYEFRTEEDIRLECFVMQDHTAELRLRIYGHWIATGRAPLGDELSVALNRDVRPGLEELAAAHTIVLEAGTDTIRMAHPFSAIATAYGVESDGVSYWANCAWDSLGIAAMLGRDTDAMAQCAECGGPVDLSVRGGAVCDQAIIHLVVPARRFWDDIVFT